jgi:hypothetical protein
MMIGVILARLGVGRPCKLEIGLPQLLGAVVLSLNATAPLKFTYGTGLDFLV